MFKLSFSNSFGRSQFSDVKESHDTLESVALEVLRVSEVPGVVIGAHEPQITDDKGNQIACIPQASRSYESVPVHGQADKHGTQTVVAHQKWEVTRVGGNEVSRRRVG